MGKLAGHIYANAMHLERADEHYVGLIAGLPRETMADEAEWAAIVVNHAQVLLQMGRTEEARRLLADQAETLRETLGAQHPVTLQSLYTLSRNLSDLGRYAEAEEAVREALAGYRARFGEDHSFTQHSLVHLIIVVRRQRRLDEAEAMANQLLEYRGRRFGQQSLEVAEVLDILGAIQHTGGDSASAVLNTSRAIEIYASFYDDQNPKLMDMRYNLAMSHAGLNQYEEAEAIFLELRKNLEAYYGAEHPYVFDVIHNSARWRVRQKRFEEALPFAEEGYAKRLEFLGEDHFRTIDSKALLGTTLTGLGRYEEAEPLLLEAWEAYDRIGMPQRKAQRQLGETLEALFLATDRPEEAGLWGYD